MSDTTVTDEPLRPETWSGYVGQQRMKDRLRIHIDAALKDGRSLNHILLAGAPGYGKTTLGHLIADELCLDIEVINMPIKPRAFLGLIRSWDGGVLVLDEIHRGTKAQQEDLMPLLYEGYMQLSNGRRIHAPEMLTIIGCTTEPDKVIAPLRERFPIRPRFVDYNDEQMGMIVQGMAAKVGVGFSQPDMVRLGKACGGTPRTSEMLMYAARDLKSKYETDPTVEAVLHMCDIDDDGLTADHIAYLDIVNDCGGFGVGLTTITTLMRLPDATIREIERLLLKRAFISLEKTGRELAPNGHRKIKERKRKGS